VSPGVNALAQTIGAVGLEMGNAATTIDSLIQLNNNSRVVFGDGLIGATNQGSGLLTISLDPAFVSYRVAPPPASGPALDSSGQPIQAGAWAADGIFFYLTVSTPNGPVWARVPLSTSW